MPTTRRKVIKTIYKDEDSEQDGDFSDSGSDAKFSAEEESSSEEEEADCANSSGDEFNKKNNAKPKNVKTVRKKPFVKTLIKKINKQSVGDDNENTDVAPALFSVKDLTEADKLLPPILNLSESDSSDDESPQVSKKSHIPSVQLSEPNKDSFSDNDVNMEYKDVWSNNIQDDSEEIAKKTFMELEQHKSKIEETKASLQKYTSKLNLEKESDIKDLLAMGEEVIPEETEIINVKKKTRFKKQKDESDSEMEDWEEVKESKAIPQQGIQLFVEFPEAGCRKRKKVDVEMMMKRKINRVKKEYQVYMHKVHVLCWIAHGNFVSSVLNDQELMAAALSLVPSKECYPGDRVDMKYVEQIVTWYKDKLTLKQDKNEDKFKPKAPHLKMILLEQMKNRVVTTRKYLVFIFVSMLRALGLQCRVMFNFVTLPIKPSSTELCSLSTKPKDDKSKESTENKEVTKVEKVKKKVGSSSVKAKTKKIAQLDGNDDSFFYSDDENIMQVDGSDDPVTIGIKNMRSTKRTKANENTVKLDNEDVTPPKIPKRTVSRACPKPAMKQNEIEQQNTKRSRKVMKNTTEAVEEKDDLTASDTKSVTKAKEPIKNVTRRQNREAENNSNLLLVKDKSPVKNTTNTRSKVQRVNKSSTNTNSENSVNVPTISVTNADTEDVSSQYFENTKPAVKISRLSRKRSQTTDPKSEQNKSKVNNKEKNEKVKSRTKSAPNCSAEKSKYFESVTQNNTTLKRSVRIKKEEIKAEDSQRVSHRLFAKAIKEKSDVTGDLKDIIKNRIKDAKLESQKGVVKGKIKKESDDDSDYLPVEDSKRRNSESEDDFKPTKISPKPSTSRRIDRRVLSSTSSEEPKKNKIDVWCEIFVEELEQWISVDVIKGKVHATGDLYNNATHPVCYVIGWDNNNYLKDLTRKYVPHWNTVTRKLRAEAPWWDKAVKPWLGPKTAREREEDEYLDKLQLEAPLPKSIAEYKNHPLYALKRHLLKFEAIYPPDAATLGFVRNEPVYARECVYVCRSRDTWLKEAKVVKLGEKPYKVVKARPKWDKLSNKLITDKPLEVFGPWQVQDYEPPTAENGIVPRNAYGNVELFKDCMLPKGTVHIKLPGLNRVAKKLNIDCAPAMTGFDFNGGWSHPVYDGFVVCQEFEEIVTEAWVKDQEEQERKELEKIEARVYGNWKRLIKGLLIRERLKYKYGFEKPSTSETSKKSKGPRLVVKRKS